MSLVFSDPHSRFLWIKLYHHPLLQNIYITIYYFPLATSNFAIHTYGYPHQDLYEDITKYTIIGEVLLLRVFSARTSSMQVPFHDLIKHEMQFQELDLDVVRTSSDSQLIVYGKHVFRVA